ncbi:MAG TPA: matrixin family metalloprotease [Gemmatimonadaceae bacterium]|jgi:hypothetical protein|nr:matrixin family metalloprotease [Gemmatimonadaceae bacterium]
MKRAVIPFLSLALGICVLGAFQSSPIAEPKPVRHVGISSGALARMLAAVTAMPSRGNDDHDDNDDHTAARRRLLEGQAGTYIGDILLERDSSLARWPDREGMPLSVWIQPKSPLANFSSAFVGQVREAFREWDEVELPLHFRFVNDSASAEVHVTWIDRFDEPISGRTRWERDDAWEITSANIVLALRHHQGDRLDDESVRAMALHEIGHLLGLDHTTDSLSVMAPKVRVRQLSQADRATARLLYALPSGPVR